MSNASNFNRNQRVTNISDFLAFDHNNPQYSSSNRGYVGQDKSNYSLSPNHTKLPSNNFGYFVYALKTLIFNKAIRIHQEMLSCQEDLNKSEQILQCFILSRIIQEISTQLG